MSNNIPDIDRRVRSQLLRGQNVQDLCDTLKCFFDITNIRHEEKDNEVWLKAILLVQSPEAFDIRDNDGLKLTPEEERALKLDREVDKPRRSGRHRRPLFLRNDWHKWRALPWQQWQILVLCAMGATIQGWAEAAFNGVQTYCPIDSPEPVDSRDCFPGAEDAETVGLVSSAPYLCCILSCWLSPLLNSKLGRRGAVYWSTIFSIASPLLQAQSNTWWALFISRLLLGVGIGIKSATIPVYVAETSPAGVRGSLVMFFQVFTAFGIMLGCLTGVAFQRNWRYILASPVPLAVLLFLFTYRCHESPRWTVAKAHRLRLSERYEAAKCHYEHAWKALSDLSLHRLIAARDMLSHYYLLDEERKDLVNRLEKNPTRPEALNSFSELFVRRRNRRAILASSICMFAQQFCGVNIIVYYSNYIFGRMDHSSNIPRDSLLYTAGFGLINFLFASPAFFLIDTVGRRTLLLCTFPFLAIFHFTTMAGFEVGVHQNQTGAIISLLGMYLFGIFYSFGEGPVPFVYASESMPLYCRETAMALVVSINWLFNWIVAYTAPLMLKAWGPAKIFAFYGAMCCVCWVLILFFVPETRSLTLEELGTVFEDTKTRQFVHHAYQTLQWWLYKHKREDRPESLYIQLPPWEERQIDASAYRPSRFKLGEMRRGDSNSDWGNDGEMVRSLRSENIESCRETG